MLTLVVARYNEDVSWVNLIPANVVIVNKSAIGNTGREAASYLWYIARHYHALEGDYLFCQGDPFPHCPDFVGQVNRRLTRMNADGERHFGVRLTCDWQGNPHHPGLPIAELVAEMDLPPELLEGNELELEFTAGAQFLRSADEIQDGCSPEYYEDLLAVAKKHPQAPWVLERLWDYLIPTGENKQ